LYHGKNEGTEWAKSASYTDLVYALKYDYMNRNGFATISILDDDL